MISIEAIWLRIRLHEGATFRTKLGSEFAYEIDGDRLRTTDKSPWWQEKEFFAEALTRVPASRPKDLEPLKVSPSYIWAILHDKRIRGSDY